MVSAFTLDETVLLTTGREIQELNGLLESRLVPLNVPEAAPPELPRLVLQTKSLVLNVCLNRFQFMLTPPDHVAGSYDETLEYVTKQVRPHLAVLFGSSVEYEWSGMVTTTKYPKDLDTTPTAIAAVRPVFEQLIDLDWNSDELASFNLKVGRTSGGYFKTFEISGYAIRHFDVMATPGRRFVVDHSEGEIAEVGLQMQVDVNNKPTASGGSATEDYDLVAAEHQMAFLGMPESLQLSEIIES